MVAVVLLVGITNLCLGFALAVYLPQFLPNTENFPAEPLQPNPSSPDTARLESPPGQDNPSGTSTPGSVNHDLPDEWQKILGGAIEAKSFVEASVHVLRLEVGRYRDVLMSVEQTTRDSCQLGDRAGLADCLVTLQQANTDWLQRQDEAAGYLREQNASLGAFTEVGQRLEEVLRDQREQIHASLTLPEAADFDTDFGGNCDRLIDQISALIHHCHVLRDRMHEALLAIAKSEGSLPSLDPALQVEPGCQAYNRTGFEALCERWWEDDPQRQRQLAVLVVNIDRFAFINRVYGTHAGDRMLAAFAVLFGECLRQGRGYDHVARTSGDTFVAFLGDTGPRGAMSAIERIRQTIENSSFLLGSEDICLTLRASVVEVTAEDTVASILDRGSIGLAAAKSKGGNCTVAIEADGQIVEVTPPTFKVRPQAIRVEGKET